MPRVAWRAHRDCGLISPPLSRSAQGLTVGGGRLRMGRPLHGEQRWPGFRDPALEQRSWRTLQSAKPCYTPSTRTTEHTRTTSTLIEAASIYHRHADLSRCKPRSARFRDDTASVNLVKDAGIVAELIAYPLRGGPLRMCPSLLESMNGTSISRRPSPCNDS